MKPAQAMAPDSKLQRFLWHPAVAIVVRLLLGGILIYTGLQKLDHPHEFARIISNYRILHPQLVNLPAIILPWLEVMVGALLLLGLLRPSSAVIACGLFALFTLALGLAMARGIASPCGCFSTAANSERIGWGVLLRDCVLVLLSAYLIVHPSRFAELDGLLEKEKPVS